MHTLSERGVCLVDLVSSAEDWSQDLISRFVRFMAAW